MVRLRIVGVFGLHLPSLPELLVGRQNLPTPKLLSILALRRQA